MLSESKILFPSNGIPPGRNGFDPVAISILSATTVSMDSSRFVTKMESVPPESAKEARPSTYTTPAASSCRRISAALDDARSKQFPIISFQMLQTRMWATHNLTWMVVNYRNLPFFSQTHPSKSWHFDSLACISQGLPEKSCWPPNTEIFITIHEHSTFPWCVYQTNFL